MGFQHAAIILTHTLHAASHGRRIITSSCASASAPPTSQLTQQHRAHTSSHTFAGFHTLAVSRQFFPHCIRANTQQQAHSTFSVPNSQPVFQFGAFGGQATSHSKPSTGFPRQVQIGGPFPGKIWFSTLTLGAPTIWASPPKPFSPFLPKFPFPPIFSFQTPRGAQHQKTKQSPNPIWGQGALWVFLFISNPGPNKSLGGFLGQGGQAPNNLQFLWGLFPIFPFGVGVFWVWGPPKKNPFPFPFPLWDNFKFLGGPKVSFLNQTPPFKAFKLAEPIKGQPQNNLGSFGGFPTTGGFGAKAPQFRGSPPKGVGGYSGPTPQRGAPKFLPSNIFIFFPIFPSQIGGAIHFGLSRFGAQGQFNSLPIGQGHSFISWPNRPLGGRAILGANSKKIFQTL